MTAGWSFQDIALKKKTQSAPVPSFAASVQSCFEKKCRNPFPEPLLLTVLLKSSGETGQIVDREHAGAGESRATEDDETSNGMDRERDSAAGGSDGGAGGGRGDKMAAGARGRVPFLLLLKKATDLVLQPFQALQVRYEWVPNFCLMRTKRRMFYFRSSWAN